MNTEELEHIKKRLEELREEWKVKPANRKILEIRGKLLKIIIKRNEEREKYNITG